MEKRINYSRLTDRYLDGELRDEEYQMYEDELLSNSDLAKDLELHRELNQAIRETDVIRFRNQLDKIHASVEPEYQQSIARKVIHNNYARIAAASVVLLLAIGLFLNSMLNKPANGDELFQRYYEAPVLSETVRSDAAMDNLYYEAVIHFNNGEFNEALALFEQVVALDDSNMKAHLATGISKLEINHAKEAKKSFKTVIDHQDNLYVDKANWFLALCYLKTDDLDNARLQFGRIASDDRSYKQDEARKILKKLDR
jgi:tetratricopeptide (TPR) repeat protein